MTMKPARVASGATLLLALAFLWGCVQLLARDPEPTGQPALAAPAGITAIRVVTVSDMATTAVRVDERSATSPAREPSRVRVTTTTTSSSECPRPSLTGPLHLASARRRSSRTGQFPVVDSVVRRRSAAPWAHLIAEFEVPLGSRPESIRVPSGGSGDAVISFALPAPYVW